MCGRVRLATMFLDVRVRLKFDPAFPRRTSRPHGTSWCLSRVRGTRALSFAPLDALNSFGRFGNGAISLNDFGAIRAFHKGKKRFCCAEAFPFVTKKTSRTRRYLPAATFSVQWSNAVCDSGRDFAAALFSYRRCRHPHASAVAASSFAMSPPVGIILTGVRHLYGLEAGDPITGDFRINFVVWTGPEQQ